MFAARITCDHYDDHRGSSTCIVFTFALDGEGSDDGHDDSGDDRDAFGDDER